MDRRGYDFSQSLEKKMFNFGPRNPEALSVDASLAGLFDCLTMECSGVLVHPQWKHFRHIQMLKNDQIRLSNGIWRSWHIQYFHYGFSMTMVGYNNEAVVLEGKYWKRNKDAVAREYRKWRLYYYKQQRILKLGPALATYDSTLNQSMDDVRNWSQAAQMDTTFVNYFQSDGTSGLMDTLLFDTTVPYSRASLDTDIMQPNLDMLNPTLDELLDHLEPMDVTFARSTAPGFLAGHNSFSTAAALSMLSGSRGQPSRSMRQQQNMLSDMLQLSLPGPSSAAYEQYGMAASSFLTQLGFPQKASPASRPQLLSATFVDQLQDTMQAQGGYPSSSATTSSVPQGALGGEEYPMSPTTFLRLSALEEAKDPTCSDPSMELGEAAQFINFAMKSEPASEEAVPRACSAPLPRGLYRPLNASLPRSSPDASGSASHGLACTTPTSGLPGLGEYQRTLSFNPQLSPMGAQSLPSQQTVHYSSQQYDARTPPSPGIMSPSLSVATTFARTKYPQPQYSPQHTQTPPSPRPPPDAMPPPQSTPTSFAGRVTSYSPQHAPRAPPSPRPPASDVMPPPANPPGSFPRVLSSGSLPSYPNTPPPSSSSHPPLERGTSEPTRSLQAQVRKLSEQHEEQMRELERQQGLAQLQYNQVLEQYLKHSTEQTSQHQQQILQSVLADPNLVNILKTVLFSGGQEGGGVEAMKEEGSGAGDRVVVAEATKAGFLNTGGGFSRAEGFRRSSPPPPPPSPSPVQAKPLQVTPLPQAKQAAPLPQAKALQLQPAAPLPQAKLLQVQPLAPPPQAVVATSSSSSLAHLVCPTQLAKATGISDFQSRLLVAAAQASSSESSPTPSVTLLSSSSRSPYNAETDVAYSPSVLQRRLKNPKQLSSEEKVVYKELRRQSHISAEQKRRGSIKQGFDHLQSLLINPATYPTGKVSKTAILEKCIEYIEDSHQKRLNRDKKIEALKMEVAQLNRDISDFQQKLPASGAPITRQRFEENRQRFREYVQRKTLQNYKFWIFSIILQQLFDTYNTMVATGSTDELCRTVLTWFEQKCSLPSLRPVVLNSLKELSVKTSILSDPSQVPQQLKEYASLQHMEEQDSGQFTGLQ